MVAANGIDDELDALAIRQPSELKCPVARAVVDCFMQTALFEEGMFAAARGSEDRGTDMAGDVDGG